MPITLQGLTELTSNDTVLEVISSFKCFHDNDIESFLREKAILFDRKGKSRTYFIINDDALESGIIEVVAYFSLAIHFLRVPEKTTPSQIKRLDGLYSRRGSWGGFENLCNSLGVLASLCGRNDNLYANVASIFDRPTTISSKPLEN